MKIGFVSLGCPKNLVDTEVMLGLAEQAGHEVTNRADGADVIVVNTCAFIDKAKEESIETILEMARHKQNGTCRRLVVTGCLAERYKADLRQEMPEIDVVLGTDGVPDIVRALNEQPQGSGTQVQLFRNHLEATSSAPSVKQLKYLYDADTPRRRTTASHLAYVKVAEGCDYSCAFCIIPTLRGGYRSRPPDSIVTEARTMAERGVKELILISQDTTMYGLDRNDRGALSRLLHALNDIDGLEWIRLLYLYPTTIGADTIDAIADCDKVCNYIDLPLQHAADRLLKRMGRPGTRMSYELLLESIRHRIPEVALRTTFIVGFPGETDEDFRVLCDFIENVRFDHIGVFIYSHEEGTRAFALTDDVSSDTKARRRQELMLRQRKIVERRQAERVGQKIRVLVEGRSKEHPLVVQARWAGQAPEIDSVTYLTECDPSQFAPGRLVDAEILGGHDYDLFARPLP
ncbi:MAG: 30S ribosomal protein S12 methylthiotransferase RimO [Vicinamibacterales bacterium]|mgnify:FL=1|jgi:ribosomal protein S12 methylthiotransferase|nr:30S ribosomal protein S12 methylthiotransferase RimO [Acidobacteriota bacterium]MDP7211875.1 30S ribosomal protein S12 methylthiotransferase RimO [Vicinamibacterales bacterium]HJO17447.1 30S ribosomal protein S12 methylthiotransferase RimO [Vicinamibacterales bacterium]|tara:strand:+ start:31630 stop:33009 length:1380 start_codon:yes stop_codon:yes gene_type:complete